jgi:hypothetical protein
MRALTRRSMEYDTPHSITLKIEAFSSLIKRVLLLPGAKCQARHQGCERTD